MMRTLLLVGWVALVAGVAGVGCQCGEPAGGDAVGGEAPGTLVVYTGRSLALVQPLIQRFEAETGVKVRVRDGQSSELASLLLEEGARSPADLFWAQEVGTLAELEKAGLLAPAPASARALVAPAFAAEGAAWVPTSGRARTLAYHRVRVDAAALPQSVFELTEPRFRGRVAWAPANASFQDFVTAMRALHGEARAEAWLRGMIANEARAYPKNTAVLQAIASEAVDYGLVNHYYLLRELAQDAAFPVAQTFFAEGDVGNLVNVAGLAVLASSGRKAVAERFVAFVLSEASQGYFATSVLEYPVIAAVPAEAALPEPRRLAALAPRFDWGRLAEHAATLAMLRKVGAL